MVLDSKFVFIVLVVLATEMDVSVTSSDLKVKQFLAQVHPVLTDPSLLFLSACTFRAILDVTAHVKGVL